VGSLASAGIMLSYLARIVAHIGYTEERSKQRHEQGGQKQTRPSSQQRARAKAEIHT
jgi:hypothetical protein